MAIGKPTAAICVQEVDVPSELHFTLIHTVCCALHRHTSRVIHRTKLYMHRFYRASYSPTQDKAIAGRLLTPHYTRVQATRLRRTQACFNSERTVTTGRKASRGLTLLFEPSTAQGSTSYQPGPERTTPRRTQATR